MMTAHNLLDDPLLSWRDARGIRDKTTLPGVLARLATGELADFPRVRAHQFHPWCMFLTQLAAIGLRRLGKTDPRLSADEWRRVVLELTDGAREPWCLVVEDLAKPAFFQPPVPEATIDEWPRSEHPDDVDILVTSKNHDVKSSVISGDDVEAWILALATLQTMQGRPGPGYNRIARMNGAYGSRPRIGLSPDETISNRFARDVQVLLDSWDTLVERNFSNDGLALVWTKAWDGNSGLAMTELAPHFIEICWRVRCQALTAGVTCAYTTTTVRRCLREIENGDAGDPWIPVERDGRALTVGRGGFHYELLTRLLLEGDFKWAAAQTPRADDPDPTLFLASVMARGQGKTEGLHESKLILTGPVRRRLGQPESRAAMGRRARENVERAKMMRTKVLFPALKRICLGETTVEDSLDARVNEVFFAELFASLEENDDQARFAWDQRLREMAWDELQRAIGRCVVPAGRWYRAVSEAEGTFLGCLHKQFPTLAASPQNHATRGAA